MNNPQSSPVTLFKILERVHKASWFHFCFILLKNAKKRTFHKSKTFRDSISWYLSFSFRSLQVVVSSNDQVLGIWKFWTLRLKVWINDSPAHPTLHRANITALDSLRSSPYDDDLFVTCNAHWSMDFYTKSIFNPQFDQRIDVKYLIGYCKESLYFYCFRESFHIFLEQCVVEFCGIFKRLKGNKKLE